MTVIVRIDSKGNPRCITNSKGRKRRPGSKDLTSILKNCDPVFVNFVSRCLEYVDTVTQCKITQHNREPSLCSTMHDSLSLCRAHGSIDGWIVHAKADAFVAVAVAVHVH